MAQVTFRFTCHNPADSDTYWRTEDGRVVSREAVTEHMVAEMQQMAERVVRERLRASIPLQADDTLEVTLTVE